MCTGIKLIGLRLLYIWRNYSKYTANLKYMKTNTSGSYPYTHI